MKKKSTLTPKEIVERLKWFHGEDFEKYPLDEERLSQLETKRQEAL